MAQRRRQRAERVTPVPVGVRRMQPMSGSGRQHQLGAEVIAGQMTGDPAEPMGPPIELDPLTAEQRLTLLDREREPMVVALRLKGVALSRIADICQCPPDEVRRILRNVRARGELDDVTADLLHDALPRSVEQLLAALDRGEAWAIQHTLKGLGAFKTYRQQDQHTDLTEERTLHVTFDTSGPPIAVQPGNIVGVPRGELPATPQETTDALHERRRTTEVSCDGGPRRDQSGDRAALGSGVEGEGAARARRITSLNECV